MSGFERHRQSEETFREDIFQKTCKGRYGLVTGGTSGIGKYCAEFLAERQANVIFTGRNEQRGQEIAKSSEQLRFLKLDMIDWDSFSEAIKDLPKLDFVILNAGGMPEGFQKNNYGLESQFASQLMGHYLLIDLLDRKGLLTSNCRIVWVTSGGMYLRKLTLDILEQDLEYNKVATYANTKRAQVILVEELSKSDQFKKYEMNCMHPGWVDTPGVQTAIPGFREKTKNRLRDYHAGADTILWMVLTKDKLKKGELYFDRKEQPKYSFFWTKENPEIRSEYLRKVENYRKKFLEKNK